MTGGSFFALRKWLGAEIPASIEAEFRALQVNELARHVPLLYFAIGLNVIASALAAVGDYPAFYHFIFPGLMLAAALFRYLVWRKRRGQALTLELARRQLRQTLFMSIALGLTGGLWTVGAYYETAEQWRAVTPMFMLISTFATTACLASYPRAALCSILTGLTPITFVMISSPDIGERAIAASIILVSLLQARLLITKFSEAIRTAELQHEMRKLAESDPLTGLANRRAFMAQLEAAIANADEQYFSVAMIDLDGFKPVNDRHGHAAGDAVLCEVAARLSTVCPSAALVARLGGDEFAILFKPGVASSTVDDEAAAVQAFLAMPYRVGDMIVKIGASLGTAYCHDTATTASALLHAADSELYANKAARQGERRKARHVKAAA